MIAVGWSAQTYAARALEPGDGTLPVGAFAAWIGDVANSALLLPVMLILLLFPGGKLPSPRWRLVAWPLAVVLGLRVLAVGVGPRIGDAIDREVPNHLGIEGLGALTGAADALGFFATPVMLHLYYPEDRLTLGDTETLKRHRKRQLEERVRIAGMWQDHGLVFTTELGTPLNRHNLIQRSFKPLLNEAKLPDIRFHDLRHTCATLLLTA